MSADLDDADFAVIESLVRFGAPLLVRAETAHWSLEETLARGLVLAHRQPTVLRVLPIVVARNAERMDWRALRTFAERLDVTDELGFIVELTGGLAGDPRVDAGAAQLDLRPSGRARPFFLVRSQYERELARLRTPALAHRWGFTMNMDEEIFRSAFTKFCHAA